MALFGSDYDRDYGYRSNRDFGYERGFTGPRRETAWGTGYGAYDRDYGFGRPGYDWDYKSRWQTDYGDPFNDRGSRTPMRMMRGGFHRYDRGFRGGSQRDWNATGYDRDFYATNPMGYDPYPQRGNRGREGTWTRGYDRDFQNFRPGRDRGWF